MVYITTPAIPSYFLVFSAIIPIHCLKIFFIIVIIIVESSGCAEISLLFLDVLLYSSCSA